MGGFGQYWGGMVMAHLKTELQVPQPGGGSDHPGLLSSGTGLGSIVVFSMINCGQAFRGGITAGQIIKFLQQQVHSTSLASPGPPVPPTVTDQIRYTDYIILSCFVLYCTAKALGEGKGQVRVH